MKQFLIIIQILTSSLIYGQESKTTNFISEITKYDISDLWTLNEFQWEFEDYASIINRQEPFGYIGENYQRFYIHYISAIQNHNNPFEYFIYGKTKVKENICSFQGTIKITECRTLDKGDIPTLKQGFVKGQYEFYEDPDQKGTGILKGNFRTNFYIDESGKIQYDAIAFVADGFNNNQFEGNWTSYNTGESKKCNWGDYRIPDSKDLDCGAGEFGVVEKYQLNGWASYLTATGIKVGNLTKEEAREIEDEKWWIDIE